MRSLCLSCGVWNDCFIDAHDSSNILLTCSEPGCGSSWKEHIATGRVWGQKL